MTFNRLTWGVKASFRSYVEAVEGTVELSDGATRTDDGAFVFTAIPGGDLTIAADGSASGAMRFQGTVTFEAHGGMLKSTIAEVGLEAGEEGLVLTTLDAPMNQDRCEIAKLSFAEVGADNATILNAEITLDGSYQIADNYPPALSWIPCDWTDFEALTSQQNNPSVVRERYRRFARYEAHGVSPTYEAFADLVATNQDIINFLLTLPEAKQQPNLLFGAFRKHCGTVDSADTFCRLLLRNLDPVRATMLEKSTQTNEPARCATLLPVLANLPQPIALLEVGASAGLCLYPDRYAYDFGEHELKPAQRTPAPPRFTCLLDGNVPVPHALPDVVWRAGIDLNPLSVENDEDMAWLETLIWPEQSHRVENLRRAVAIARMEPPRITRGNLLSALEPLAQEAPAEATLVIFHTAVLAYVADRALRDDFVVTLGRLPATWISNEHPAVFPEIAAQLPAPPPTDRFLMAVDGQPVASTGPHGQSVHWLDNKRTGAERPL